MPQKTPPTPEHVHALLSQGLPFDVDETAVAIRRSPYSVRQAIASGELASFRIGRSIRVPASAIRHLLGED